MTPEGKSTMALLKATHDIVKRDVGLGFITQDDMRYSINSRRGLVLELAAKGVTQQEIAKITKTSQAQVSRDLMQGNSKSYTKRIKHPLKSLDNSEDDYTKCIKPAVRATPAEDAVDELLDEHPELTPDERWYNSFRHQAGESIAMTAYWRREFGDFLSFPITSEVVTLAKQAAEEWIKLANKLEEYYEEKASAANACSA